MHQVQLTDLSEAKAAMERRDRHRINAIVAELISQRSPIGARWRTFAEVMLFNGELQLARSAIRLFVESENASPSAKFLEATVLARIGDLREARTILQGLPAHVPDPLAHAFTSGTVALDLGLVEEAREHLVRAVGINPRSGQSWLALATAARTCGDEKVADRLLAAEDEMALAPRLEQAQYQYARGKLLDELGDYDAAFAAWSAGAELVKMDRPYDGAVDEASAKNAVAGYDGKSIAAIGKSVTVVSNQPIFVTGSPRSGTTLVEQILASHSLVGGGTELGKFSRLIETIGGTGREQFDRWRDRGGTASGATSDYLHMFEERFGAGRRAVDKTPDASRYLGLAASLLPEAPLVWIRRNRLDGALSCFRTYFHRGVAWSFDQAALAKHFILEDRLLRKWQDILGDRLFILEYEELVREPDVQIARLAKHCDLSVEPAMLEPHKTDRIVNTASVAQVREPINVRAVGSSERYNDHLQPFADAYRALGGDF